MTQPKESYQERLARLRQERLAAAKAKRRKEAWTKVAVALGGLAGALLGVLFVGVITMFAWNVGVVGVVAASGGAVGKIGLLTAIAANFAIGIVARIVWPQGKVQS